MKKYIFLLILVVGFSNCKSSKRTNVVTKKSKLEKPDSSKSTDLSKNRTNTAKPTKADQVISYSKQFLGTRYKWGGTTKRGMDCSGLVFESFNAHKVYLPRISRDMAKKGKSIKLKETLKGDLLFFKTGKNRRNTINHVGLVVEIKNNDIYFIHATSSKGVIISSLNESYWKNSFVEVRRIL
ncbi:C40 family peptidase [Hyunsoonleella pacifica]|uniref:NlpC/P60 family protein n=1 Tax=Hyunsoonleella pacifica TaxID=1080224 RepID=A0A4Q9FPX1_9FLAO|nr:C40 family peptidase [Hyunsoonleella pacifica]TBN14709.1 NlpC/P60 family protein [Hyunsoonleella pacifica]GGD16046.1 hypothetical protein GCM10011368_17520 [Hyunsoonleella pacifica]